MEDCLVSGLKSDRSAGVDCSAGFTLKQTSLNASSKPCDPVQAIAAARLDLCLAAFLTQAGLLSCSRSGRSLVRAQSCRLGHFCTEVVMLVHQVVY